MSELKIYFAGSIRGGRNDADLYSEIISYLQKYGEVLTEHIGFNELSERGETALSDDEIYARDIEWLSNADVVIAEVTNPSLGVGFEIAKAISLNKKILCLFRPQSGSRLSAMISGCKEITLKEYKNIQDVSELINDFLNMKTHIIKGLSILLIIFFTSFAGFGYNNPQLETDTLISNDSLNLAILEMDFLSNQFIRASVKHYPLCSTCDLDSLPFLWTYLPPMDFGEMQFYYSLNNQLLFGATLVWMGEGAIYYPDSFAPSSSFPLSAEITPLPSNAQYLYWPIFPSMGGFPYFKAKSDTMWNAVSNLQLVHDFAAGSHMRVGFLGYAPSQGIFNPVPARWLIFLYRGSTVTSIASVVPGEAEIKIFPNPTSQQLNIQLKNCNTKNLRFSVFDLSGRKCLEKSLNNSFSQTIDIQQLESGIYQYQIEGSGFLKKDRFVKN